MSEIFQVMAVAWIAVCAYQKGRTDGLMKDALPQIDRQFKQLEALYNREFMRNHPEIPESSGGDDGR